MIMSPVLDIVALGFAPQTVLAPFNGLSLVWNTVLAVSAPASQLLHSSPPLTLSAVSLRSRSC